jgi:hypothetical protein
MRTAKVGEEMQAWMRPIKLSLRPSLLREATMKCHSILSKALARSIFKINALDFQVFKLKE